MTTKDKIILAILPVTFFVAICMLVPALFPAGSKKGDDATAVVVNVASDKQQLFQLLAQGGRVEERPSEVNWGDRNPFAPQAPVVKAAPKPPAADPGVQVPVFVLSGILWNGGKPNAIINDFVFGVGETVSGMTVKEITEGSVTLSNDRQGLVLKMQQ